MDYIMLDIDGVLTGTINADLTLSQQALWFRLICLAGKGHGRVGFVERGEGVGYSREALYSAIGCYKDTDKKQLDEMLKTCVDSNDPRIVIYDNECIEIIKWDKYQYIPKGTIRDTSAIKARKHNEKTESKNVAIQKAKETRNTLTNAVTGLVREVNEQTKATRSLKDKIRYIPDGKGGSVDTLTGEVKDGEHDE